MQGDIADRGRRPAARRRRGCRRQLRRRVARRPLDPRPRGVPPDRASSASTSCSRRVREATRRAVEPFASCRSRPTRSTARSRTGHSREDRSARPAVAVLGGQGGRRAARRSSYVVDPRRRRGRDPRLEHVRPVPPSRELIPLFITNAIDDQPLPLYGDGLQRRDWLYRRRTTPDAIDYVLRHGATGEHVQRAGLRRDDEPRRRRGAPRAARQAVVARPPRARTGPATTGATRWTGSKLAALGWRTAVVVRGRAGGDRRLVSWRNEPWWRAARSGDWDAYYERQYGARLARRRRRPEAPCASRSPARAGGSGGRSSRALEDAPFTGLAGPIAWTRRRLRPRRPERHHALLDRDRPEVVVHAAALDRRRRLRPRPGARHRPATAMRSGVLAEATAARGIDLVHVSTNEVFDGRRDDGRGCARRPRPARSTRTARRSSPARSRRRAAYRDAAAQPGDRPTAWLYGPPGNDFPAKILAAAGRARAAGEPLKVVERRGGLADVQPRRRRGDRRAARFRATSAGSTTS